jgi:hypothetical protein
MSTYTVTTSAELMENYLQADFLLPQDEFTALQTDAGASLLFSIGTGGVFYLTIESPGETCGWRQVDLGAGRNKADFGGTATVKTFGAAQALPAHADGKAQIHLGMVLNDGTNDHLYLSLSNSDSDLGWTGQPAWTAVPFNAVSKADGTPVTPPSPFQIVNVLISEATDREYIIVDTVRNPGQGADFISRFYIDTSAPAAPRWIERDLSIDVRAVNDDSCLGRAARSGTVDGVYTKGFVGTSAQLIYTPVVNPVNRNLAPAPSLLKLPGGLIADAIAAVRNPDNTSDLYVAAQGGLYWFASTNQANQATGVLVATSPLLAAVRNLYAYTADGSVTVWGLNGDDEVFYLTCPAGRQQTPAAWNVPLSILAGVDAISPFIDRGYNANTFFAHSGTGLVKVVKSPTTGLWSSRRITLPASATAQTATPIHSYTTHVQVTEADGQQAPDVPVTLTATNVTSVYINHLYYLIGPSPIQLTTDALGTITIVETTASLAATRYQISVASQPQIAVNTMDAAWQRNAQYTTSDSLQTARIVNRDGSSRDFVPAGTSAQDLAAVAASNAALAAAYEHLSSSPAPPAAGPRVLTAPVPVTLVTGDVLEGVPVDVGDLFNCLAGGVDALVNVIKDAANDIWYVITTIGDAVYHAVLDCVEAVVAAATWIYNAIKVAVEDVLKFLEFLFGWQDILITHEVLRNMFTCMAQSAVDGIETVKTQLHTFSADLQQQIASWAGIPEFTQTAAATLAASPPAKEQNSAPANLGVHHFQGGAAAASSKMSPDSPLESILNDLVKLMEAEGETLSATVNAIKTDIIDQFSTLTVTDVIQKLLAIITDSVLQSVENVLVTALDVLAQLVKGMIELLEEKLDIPVLSWLYYDLTGKDLSFLDVICLIAAIPVTIIYKAAAQAAPFAEGDPFTDGLLTAKNWAEIQALFFVAPHAVPAVPALSSSRAVATSEATPVLDESRRKDFSFITGILSLTGGAASCIVMNFQRQIPLIGAPAGCLATLGFLANLAYVSPNFEALIGIQTNKWYGQFTFSITAIGILRSGASILAAIWDTLGGAKIGLAIVQSSINLVRLVPTIANLAYNADAYDTTYKSLIPEFLGNLFFDFGGILEFPITSLYQAASAAEPVEGEILRGTANALSGIQAGLMVSCGALMLGSGATYKFQPGQTHG